MRHELIIRSVYIHCVQWRRGAFRHMYLVSIGHFNVVLFDFVRKRRPRETGHVRE